MAEGFDPPAPDEVEVTVIGKGTGETVVAHLGPQDWVIVDSFRCPVEGRVGPPAPLRYLGEIGVDAAAAVTDVVLTHLHADHSGGIDEVVGACENAWFSMSAAVPDESWEGVLAQLSEDPDIDRRTWKESALAYQLAARRGRFGVLGRRSELNTSTPSELVAIGPSANAQRRARSVLDSGTAAALVRANCSSIVLWLAAGNATALFGADMERHRAVGWEAMRSELPNLAMHRRAELVKIPHHGSAGAHDLAMYEQWTLAAAGIVTPNRSVRGGALPRGTMLPTLQTACTTGVTIAGPPHTQPLSSLDTVSREAPYAVVARASRSTGTWRVDPPRPLPV